MGNEVMEHLKINGFEFDVNDPDAVHEIPIPRITSGDDGVYVNLRDLDSGTYVLYGKFRAYAGHTSTLFFTSDLMVNVSRSSSKSCIQIFYPAYNRIQYIEATDDSFTKTNIDFGKLQGEEVIIASSTEGSTKKFKITVDDTGTLSAAEVTA